MAVSLILGIIVGILPSDRLNQAPPMKLLQ